MNNLRIKQILATIIYPKIGKSIIELDLIENMHIDEKNKKIEILLTISDSKQYQDVVQQLEKSELKNLFDLIETTQKVKQKPSRINYD